MPPEPAEPVLLSYATADSDGLPEFHPEAEALIAAGSPPDALRKLMGSARQAARYYGKSFARRHAAEATDDVCCLCGHAPAGRLAMTTWRVHKPTHSFVPAGATAVARVDAFHPICLICETAWRTRALRWRWLRHVRRIVAFSGVAVPVTGFSWMLVDADLAGLIFVIVLGLFVASCLGLTVLSHLAVRRMTPQPILAYRRRHFSYLGFIATGERADVLAADRPVVEVTGD